MNKKLWVLLSVIVVLGAAIRLYNISSVPPGINRDEGSIGYTAYSLLKTGRDEYGRMYPLSFQSFGDWKLPLYIYTVMPMVAVFGLNEFAVRIPSVVAGILTIVLTFFFVRELFRNNIVLAYLTTFLVSIAPWAIHLSRVESESNTAVMLATAGMVLLLKAIRNRSWVIILSLALFSLTYYTYAGNYIFTTLLLLGIVYLYWPFLIKLRWSWVAGGVFVVLSFIIFSQTIFSANKTKLSGIGIFGDPAVVHAKIEIPRNEHTQFSSIITRLFHNRVEYAVERIWQNYINSFSPQFLFIQGGTNKAHNIQNFGNMYLIESVFLVIGFIYLVTHLKGKEEKLVLWWFLIAPIAVSITKDAPHTNRMFAIFPMLPLITAMGVYVFWRYIQQSKYRYFFASVVALLFIFNIGLYFDRYFLHFPRDEAQNWGVGYQQLVKVIDEQYQDKHIIMTRPHYSPYIFLLFYSRYDPAVYMREAVRYPITSDGFLHVKKYGQYEFRDIDWTKDIQIPNSLLVADPSEVPDVIKSSPYKKADIVLPNNEIMFSLIETP